MAEIRIVQAAGRELAYTLTVKAVKNINLRVQSDGTVAVSANRQTSKAVIDGFVKSRADWILGHCARLESQRALPLPAVPQRKLAEPVLAAALERVYPCIAPLGVPRPTLRARRMKSRWGSCHYAKGLIVMNTVLAAVPEELLDYVTLHELAHFLHPNHGPGFYATLTSLMPDWQTRRHALRGYEGMLKGDS